jgi:protocatechuate 3,4-dioxygenase beta subunit
MKRAGTRTWTRNRFLRAVVIAPAAFVLAACTGGNGDNETPETGGQAAASGTAPATTGTARNEAGATATTAPPITQALPPTPDCGDDDEPTIAQTEGPYFTPNSPERTSLLEPGMSGTRLSVTGFVLTTDCQPVQGALVDFWQCDDAGEYDNRGYRLRGHQFTDDNGRYILETIVPGLYTGRTRHIHVKVQAPNSRILTTQQYFPDEPGNRRDGIFNSALVMDVQDTPNGKTATFNYVLDLA